MPSPLHMHIPVKAPLSRYEIIQTLRRKFAEVYSDEAQRSLFLIAVPLRLAPLGAHSDHQGGTVTGFAIDRYIYLLGQESEVPAISVASLNFDQQCVASYESISSRVQGDWGNYARGAVTSLQSSHGRLTRGLTAVVYGEMPIGGLSSSAAVTLAYLSALQHTNQLKLSPLDKIMLVRSVENGYLGLHNGILDQSVIVSSVRGALTVIDCATNSISSVPQQQASVPWEILVVYSGLSRQLTSTPFNQRVAECREAAGELLCLLGRESRGVPSLGEISCDEFEQVESKLSSVSQKRARHFFSEASRVREGIGCWTAGDIKRFGELVTASGNSSIVNYESGSPALVSLYEILSKTPGVYGTRFCGGGFQGCCLALIDPRCREAITEQLHTDYTASHPEAARDYSIHICSTANSISCEVLS